ncbi:helix-turn-helix transcriptional regulator [Nonomuraea sp. SMC257]|uniref:Helix-turn-helix transcriptional regulator n=1 Tax=Nonomuraea montanisoli TaxID=2741721 RepID=A0A7Y6M1G5_9ACTN|nr:TetR/AcrR family transcriptional regulator [Nonomuraea montanisoli]NUW31022.1 helix-turn-helix transcriptional regulator [Nonomuraea montanisoli]
MTVIRHNDGVLDAARDCVLAFGVRRTTLTDVARRAGVSRMTLYRRWPDVRSLVADLMTREWLRAVEDLDLSDPVAAVVEGVRRLRSHPLWVKIVEADPELLLPYLLHRRGATHDAVLTLLERVTGDPRTARAVLLVAQSFLISAPAMTGPGGDGGVTLDDLDAELAALLEGYLGQLEQPRPRP